MNDDPHTGAWAVGKIIFAWVAFLGTVTLSQWAAIVGIISGLLAATFTALQVYILWRDKIARYRPSGSHTRETDHATLIEDYDDQAGR